MSDTAQPSLPQGEAAAKAVNGGSSRGAGEPDAQLPGVPAGEIPGLGKRPIWGRSRGANGASAAFWRILCQCEIGNFATLRRHLGRPRTDGLALDVAERITGLFPGIRVLGASRALVELAFEHNEPNAALAEVERLRQAFERPIEIDGERFQLKLHFGLAASPAADCDEVCLTEAAESALEQSRAESRVVMLDLSRADFAFDKLTLMRELPRGIANGEMFLQYQPKVHVRRQEIAGAEALIRWQHPQRGLILPGDFIGVAEEAGEIASLTLWTLRQVIADQQRLAADGFELTLFLNISGMLLADSAFVSEACAIVSESGAKLGFEITETAVIRDPSTAIRHLQQFADIGVRLAIDDYGAGLSSLAYLKQLPASELKIDKMFVLQLTSSNRDPLIVRSTIDLAHALDMEVTAEGVETPSALALLSVMGCDMVQGFLISRPLGFEAFRRFLEDDAHMANAGSVQSAFIRPESFWKRA